LTKTSAVRPVDGTLMEKSIGNAFAGMSGMFLVQLDDAPLASGNGKKHNVPQVLVAAITLLPI